MLDSSLASLSARYDLINFDLWPGIVCPEKEGLGPALQRACEHTVVICTTTITSPRSYQLGNIALHSCQVGWKKGSRSPKDSNLCWCDTRLSVVCPPQMVKNQYEVFDRKQNKQTTTDLYRGKSCKTHCPRLSASAMTLSTLISGRVLYVLRRRYFP